MPSGGKREGAGRPRVREQHAAPVRAAEKKIVDRLPEIVDAQIELALGVMVEEVSPTTGALTIYRQPPDGKAGQYLINRILGLPQAKVNLDGSGGFRIHVVYGDDADTTD
jgi:hypothetical protein